MINFAFTDKRQWLVLKKSDEDEARRSNYKIKTQRCWSNSQPNSCAEKARRRTAPHEPFLFRGGTWTSRAFSVYSRSSSNTMLFMRLKMAVASSTMSFVPTMVPATITTGTFIFIVRHATSRSVLTTSMYLSSLYPLASLPAPCLSLSKDNVRNVARREKDNEEISLSTTA